MNDDGELLVGGLFSRCDLLSVASRLELADLCAVPGRRAAILGDDLALLPVPGERDARSLVGALVREGVDAVTLGSLASETFGGIVPGVERLDGAIGVVPPPVRLFNLLEHHGATSWRALAGLSVADVVSWHGAGLGTVHEIVGLLVDSILATSGPGRSLAEDVGLLLDDVDIRAAVERLTSPETSEHVRAAAARVLRTSSAPGSTVSDDLLRILRAAGDVRDRGIFEHRSLALQERASYATIGQQIGLRKDRMRELRTHAEQRVRMAFDGGPEPTRAVGARLAQDLGPVTRVECVDRLLALQGLPVLPDPRALLLLWLAGPYAPVDGKPGWLALEPVELATDWRLLLLEDGGVRSHDHVSADLAHLGVVGDHVEPWLASQPVRLIDGLVVALVGRATDVAERLLSAAGREMTLDELVELGGDAVGDGRELRSALVRDRRFRRLGDSFELREWGGEACDNGDIDDETSTSDGRHWLRIEVDDAVLAGAPGQVPLPFVESLGVEPGRRRTFSTRFGPVALGNDGARSSRSSVRPVALALGAGSGDALVLGFHPDEDGAEVRWVSAADAGAPMDATTRENRRAG